MHKEISIIFVILIGYIMPACTQDPLNSSSAVTMDITVQQFNEFTLSDPGTILDVRTKNEVENGAIPGSVNIDFYAEDFSTRTSELNKSKPIYVYCAVGGRSSQAMKILNENGFKEVYNLKGGYNAWAASKKK